MEKAIGEIGKYDGRILKVIERTIDEHDTCCCIGCVFSMDDTECSVWTKKHALESMGVCRQKDRTDRKSVIFIDTDDKYQKTPEFRQYILKHIPTKLLLKEYRRKNRFVYMGFCLMEAGPYYDSSGDYCDPRVRITVGKFADWNPYKGRNFHFYYTLAETKAELDTREHIDKK